ncbi:MAG: uncharacterized protein KVP18_002209 [Porospora cf. gigantea A]|uniref:uncharacterized protein n=1 Tax=Porospora cf. gigantea A TaxID=2853593 RepID=UPI003559635E|nr:MAG: hypothetical protein KVP18_002209 [Porospora cf. gigantea A]
MTEYVYVSPVTSPFYKRIVKPFCVWLCDHVVPEYVPAWSITLFGLGLVLSSVCLITTGHHVLAGVLWSTYGVLDNVDGCQARKTGTSSRAGEFLDHAVDSLVSSLSALAWLSSIVDVTSAEGQNFRAGWLFPTMWIVGQLPFFVACWAHHVLGRLLLGSSFTKSDWFTVDEFNILFVPGLIMSRGIVPGLWALELYAGYKFSDLWLLLTYLVTIWNLATVMWQLEKATTFLPPALALQTCHVLLGTTFIVRAVTFAMLAIEVIVQRFNVHTHGVLRYLWWPMACAIPLSQLPNTLGTGAVVLTAWLVYVWNYYRYLSEKSATKE